jgi:Ribonuclease G/E
LVWNGNHEKQPKVKMGFNLVGRFVILNNTNQIKYSCKSIIKEYIDIKDLSGIIFRSSIDNLSSYELVKNEMLYLLNIRNNLNIDKFHKYGVLYEAPSITIRFIRQQNNLDDYTIYTNDSDSYDELMFYQALWGVDNINYTNKMSIGIDKYLGEVLLDKFCYQDLEIKFHSVSGINIIDLDNSNAKLNFYQSNIMALDLIIEKIKLKDLTGIILIDLIKNMTNQQKINIINRVNALFECDFRTVKIYGFTNSDLFELIRYK